MEWKFRTCFSIIRSSHGFSDPLKLCFVRSLRLSSIFPWTVFVLSFLFSSFPKSNPCICFIHFHLHSLTHATRPLCFIWFRKKGNYSSVDCFTFSIRIFLQLSFSFISIYWRSMLDFNNISLFDSRSIKWI